VKFGLIPANPFDLVKAPRAKRVKAGRALSPADAKALITASQDLRLGAAVTLLFCPGWRVAHLRKRRDEQQLEREAIGVDSREMVYDGERLAMVFTAAHGGLANQQAVTKEISRAAKIAGLDPDGLASNSGRRTVATALCADGGLDLAYVARHVGHSDPSTTAGYVRSLGHRPSDTAARAAQLLDPTI